jgi:hypothetical protein
MMLKKKQYISLGVALIVALATVGGVWAVTVEPWFWAGVVTNVSASGDIRANVSLAAETDDVAVVWSGGEGAPGIYLARNTGSGWVRSTITSTGNRANRFPALVLLNSQPLVAWSQSESTNPVDSQAQTLQQQDSTGSAHAIAGPIYGRVAPDMDLAGTGLHMVYPAAMTSFEWSRTDLYYVHRYLTETTWSAPTVVLTHSQVLPPTILGGIWSPKVAVSPDGQTLHIVWEQYEIISGPDPSRIWHIAGTWQPGGVVWGTPTRLSPLNQNYTVRPNVTVAESGIVHITWTELIPGPGGTTNPEAQYINYRQLMNATTTQLNVDAIKVNSNNPTWASSAIALHEQSLCVAWHGFYAGESIEEITMRCSKDEGESWLSLMNVSASPSLLSDFPAIAFDPLGYVHIAWEEREIGSGTYEPLDIYYRGGLPQRPTMFIPLVARQG